MTWQRNKHKTNKNVSFSYHNLPQHPLQKYLLMVKGNSALQYDFTEQMRQKD